MSEKTAKDWEDRVVLLEQEAAQAKAREVAMSKELAEAKAKADALSAGLEQARAAEKARREREVESYMSGLKASAAPNAIPEADLAKVQALFDRGDDENARFVGGLLLKGAKAGAPAGKVVPIGPTGPGAPGDRAKAETAYAAEQLRAAGWTVELSADGSAITKKTPPAAVRAGKA